MQAQEEIMATHVGKLDRFIDAVHHRREPVIRVSTITPSDTVGLYRVLADNPTSADQLAKVTGIELRCVCDWLVAGAATGHIQYDAATQRFWMTEQQALALADTAGHAFIRGGFAFWRDARLLPR
jgi:hypothetical protein